MSRFLYAYHFIFLSFSAKANDTSTNSDLINFLCVRLRSSSDLKRKKIKDKEAVRMKCELGHRNVMAVFPLGTFPT